MIEASKRQGRLALGAVAVLALLGGVAIGASGLAPAAAQPVRALGAIVNGVVTCHSASPCAGGVNTGTGFGLLAESSANNGVDSGTKNPSFTTNFGKSGLYGHDDSTDGGIQNIGVAGLSNKGTGMQATSLSGTGLQARSNSGWGINVSSINGTALRVFSLNGAGVDVESDHSSSFVGLNGLGDANPVLVLKSGTSDANGSAIQAFSAASTSIFSVDNAGNEHLGGLLYTTGSCSTGCSRTHRVESYAPRESVPSMEDIGEGQLVAGKAVVKLDPAFANVIDGNAPYVVFISPEGSSRGLYVTQKSRVGFTVMENDGGHSTIPFGYRIVAKPYGVVASRLPMVDTPRMPRSAHPLAR
jgi:hypothetical protein